MMATDTRREFPQMKKIAALLFALASCIAIAAPGSYSGNIEPEDMISGNASWWVIILSVIGVPLAWWVFSLVCNEERKEGEKVTWWTSMDYAGKGITIMVTICLIPILLGLIGKIFG